MKTQTQTDTQRRRRHRRGRRSYEALDRRWEQWDNGAEKTEQQGGETEEEKKDESGGSAGSSDEGVKGEQTESATEDSGSLLRAMLPVPSLSETEQSQRPGLRQEQGQGQRHGQRRQTLGRTWGTPASGQETGTLGGLPGQEQPEQGHRRENDKEDRRTKEKEEQERAESVDQKERDEEAKEEDEEATEENSRQKGQDEREGQEADNFTLLHYNLRSLNAETRLAELVCYLEQHNPTLLALNETWLDPSKPHLVIPNYELVHRRDRPGWRPGTLNHGGVALYKRSGTATVTHLEDSDTAERSWFSVHTTLGPILLAVWYRPPAAAQEHLDTFESELAKLTPGNFATYVVGDLNVWHKKWLKHSPANTREGEQLQQVCQTHSLKKTVKKPTRELPQERACELEAENTGYNVRPDCSRN